MNDYEVDVDIDFPGEGELLAIGFEYGYKYAKGYYETKKDMMRDVRDALIKRAEVEAS